jgi:hypothetical protein
MGLAVGSIAAQVVATAASRLALHRAGKAQPRHVLPAARLGMVTPL